MLCSQDRTLTIVFAGVKSIPATFLFKMYAVLSGVQPVLKLDREGCDVRAFRRARAADCGPGGGDWRRQKFHWELSQRYVGLRGPLSLSSAVSAATRSSLSHALFASIQDVFCEKEKEAKQLFERRNRGRRTRLV